MFFPSGRPSPGVKSDQAQREGPARVYSSAMERPRKILLATDLSARSDRAMDRAALIAREHAAELVVLVVMEPSRADASPRYTSLWLETEPPANPRRLADLVRRHLASSADELGDRVRIRIESGDPADVILDVAREETCDLLVTGVARNEFLGRLTLGATVDRLVGAAPAPLLIVTDRASGAYRRVVVATDLSPTSLIALDMAAALSTAGTLTVFHGRHVPYTSFVSDAEALKTAAQQAALAETTAFIEAAPLSAAVRARVEVLVRAGEPERNLADLARDGAVDLVALTTHGRGAVLTALLGSVARRIVTSLPCDALVVRAPRR
jgi:nucleotide-binding universal stress UspA family protein